MNCEIINSVTKLHFDGYCYYIATKQTELVPVDSLLNSIRVTVKNRAQFAIPVSLEVTKITSPQSTEPISSHIPCTYNLVTSSVRRLYLTSDFGSRSNRVACRWKKQWTPRRKEESQHTT